MTKTQFSRWYVPPIQALYHSVIHFQLVLRLASSIVLIHLVSHAVSPIHSTSPAGLAGLVVLTPGPVPVASRYRHSDWPTWVKSGSGKW